MFYAVVASFIFGVFLQTVYAVSYTEWLIVGILAALCLLAAGRSACWSGPYTKPVLLVGVCCMVLLLGAARLEVAKQSFATSVYDRALNTEFTIVGVVSEEPDIRSAQQQLTVTTDDTIVLVSADRQYQVQYGDRIEATGVIERPGVFMTEFGRSFDYAGYLQAKGIAYRMSFAEVAVLDTGHGNWILAGLLGFKHSFMQAVATVIPEPAAGLSAGLLLGVKQALGDDLETAFRKTGIIHIVVLSGYNVMLVVAFVTMVLGYVLSLRARVLTGLIAIAAFALMVGLSATVLRASIMAGLFLLATVTGRSYQILRGLFLAGLLMVLINPFIVVYDIGFQLSFVATLGLLLVAPHFETMLMQVPQWLGVRDFFIATVATQIAVSPLLLYHIGEFSMVSVPVNMLVLPMVPVAMLATFIVGMVSYVSSSLALVLAYPAYLSLEYIIVIAEYFATVPFAAIWMPTFSFWWVPVGYGVIAVGLWLWHIRSTPRVARKEPIAVQPPREATEPAPTYTTWTIEVESEPNEKTTR